MGINSKSSRKESKIIHTPIQVETVKYVSQSGDDQLLSQLNAEASLSFAWLTDTIQPAIDLYAVKGLVYDQLNDVVLFEDKKGETVVSKAAKARIFKIIDHLGRLDLIISTNNTAKLIVKHSDLKMIQLENENKKLRDELKSAREAWENM